MLPMSQRLPAAQRQRLHADFLANEQSYYRMRNRLLPRYAGQWVAIHNNQLISAGDSLLAVTDAAADCGGHAFVARVGAEEGTIFRVRRLEFAYDSTYQPFALPQSTVTFWNHAETHSQTYGNVIPDTGADISVLPDIDCQAFDLFSSPYLTAISGRCAPRDRTRPGLPRQG